MLRRNTKTEFSPKSGAADSKRLFTSYTYQDGKHTVNGSTKTTTTGLVKTYTNQFGTSGSAASKFDYTYDSWGNITKITDKASKNRTYSYNAYGEVASATEAYSNGTTSTYTYTYDAGGNILTEKVGSTTHTYKYDSVWKDKLIAYDAFGCPLNYMGSAMTWDVNGNLTGITKGSTKISYSYLSGGQRSSKTVNGTTTTYNYNNGMLLSQTTGNETLRFYYDSMGRVASLGYKNGSAAEVGYFFTRNLHGDIIGVYRSSDSKLMGTYEYDLWGKLVSVKEASTGIDTNGILTKNPFRYRGYYYDNETGFYNLNLRYYDPAIRRFISADTMDVLLIGTDSIYCKNLFAYTENNPVNSQDSSGAVVETVWDVASLGVSIAEVWMDPTDLWAWGGLLGDAADCVIPCVGGIGEAIKGVRLIKRTGDAEVIVDGVKAVDNFHDTAKTIKSGSKASKALTKPNIVNFDSKQLGKKWGKHKKDYPDMKSYTDYQNYANDVFNNPEQIIYDAANNEYLYIKGDDLLRLGEDGEFISLYPGVKSDKVTNAIENGGTIWP